MNLIKEISSFKRKVDLKNSDSTDAGTNDVTDKIKSDDIGFSLMRNAINTDGNVTGSSVANYLERAAELNDEVDTVPFGLETDDGEIVKVYVNAEQADGFELAMKNLLGIEDDIEEAINRLSTEFDIIDVVWPESDDGEDDDTTDLDNIDLDTALDSGSEDISDSEDEEFEVIASVDDEDEDSSNDNGKSKQTDKKSVKKSDGSLLKSITAK